jgi:hypothetical protein
MNERIKELAEQAAISCGDFIGPRLYMTHEEEMEKFAELIIVKCANIIWHEADINDSAEINEGGYKILDHFGIDWRGEQTDVQFGD